MSFFVIKRRNHWRKILKIIRSLDPKKAHGWDNISINMIKLCDVAIVNPLYLIHKKCLDTGRFPISWKNCNVLPIHKKENRQLKKNYRPISLLPVCGKIFEKLIFDAIYEYFVRTNSSLIVSLGFNQVTQQ